MRSRPHIVFLLFLLFPFGLKSQQLVDSNQTWFVVDCVWGGGCGTGVFYFHGDTTIGATLYKKLQVNTDSGGGSLWIPDGVREDTISQKVFYNFNGIEHVAYDFSLVTGDTFVVTPYSFPYNLVVDSTDSVMLLNGEMRKRLYLTGPVYPEVWIEGIGTLFGITSEDQFNFIDRWSFLSCFTEDAYLKYHDTTVAGCYLIAQGIDELDKPAPVKIYPNPLEDYSILVIHNNLPPPFTLSLYNDCGQLVRTSQISTHSERIEKGDLSAGLYFFRVTSVNEIYSGKLIVR